MMQVDVDASCYANVAEGETETAKHRRSKRFTELAAAAGCYQAFVGIESLNPDNLNFATKYQNTDDRQHKGKLEAVRAHVIDKYRRVVENWHKVGVSVHAGYMLGFPFDGPDCGRVAAATLKKIGFDIVSFFIMTPLPGTEDQVRFTKEGAIIDWDFNQLDSQHVTLKHDKLDKESWLGAYRDAYTGFYSIPRFLHTMFTVCAGRGLARKRGWVCCASSRIISSAIARAGIRWSAGSGRFAAATSAAPQSPTTRRAGSTSAASVSTRFCAATAPKASPALRRKPRNTKTQIHEMRLPARSESGSRRCAFRALTATNGRIAARLRVSHLRQHPLNR